MQRNLAPHDQTPPLQCMKGHRQQSKEKLSIAITRQIPKRGVERRHSDSDSTRTCRAGLGTSHKTWMRAKKLVGKVLISAQTNMQIGNPAKYEQPSASYTIAATQKALAARLSERMRELESLPRADNQSPNMDSKAANHHRQLSFQSADNSAHVLDTCKYPSDRECLSPGAQRACLYVQQCQFEKYPCRKKLCWRK